jgi:hypothetical protein
LWSISARNRELGERLIDLANQNGINAHLLSRSEISATFSVNGRGTKHARVEMLAKKFPDELGFRLPPERRPWMSEDSRMDIFDAVALALGTMDYTTAVNSASHMRR